MSVLEKIRGMTSKASVLEKIRGMTGLDDVRPSNFADYQISAMDIFRSRKEEFKDAEAVAMAIKNNIMLEPGAKTMFQDIIIEGSRKYVNLMLSPTFIAEEVMKMINDGPGSVAPTLPLKRALVDFSSPNIAKELHVGHLRSTIIGDCIARLLEFCHVDVLRRNHVGDWGTQFGMLLEFLFDKFPQWEEAQQQLAIWDLQQCYQQAKKKFDADVDFKEKSRLAVVKLQNGEPKYLEAWKLLCEISRKEFQQLYKRLNVSLEEKGESFYNEYIPIVLELLRDKGLVEKESDGAEVVRIDGYSAPLIVKKRDGSSNYATTDLAALWYRLNVEKAEWLIYVTDVGQREHFGKVFKTAKLAGLLPNDEHAEVLPRAQHVGFGHVKGADKKPFRARNGETIRLADLLDEAKKKSIYKLNEKHEALDQGDMDKLSEALGYGAVKYADLKNNMETDYVFSFEQMLNDRGNTAIYLQYARARACSVLQKSGKDVEEMKRNGNIVLEHPDERALGLKLVRFAEVLVLSVGRLAPNILCEYLYQLAEIFTKFYTKCSVNGAPTETTKTSRLLLCHATSVVMKQCFELLGITPLDLRM